MKLTALILTTAALVVASLALAADPDGFAMYTAAQIKSRAAAAKLDANKAGADRVATWGNHGLLLVHRAGDGAAETHDSQVDVVTVVSGEGTLVVGGTMNSPKTTGPGEVRGPSITGGTKHEMHVGDVFHIPAGVPHQMLVPKDMVIQVVKVTVK